LISRDDRSLCKRWETSAPVSDGGGGCGTLEDVSEIIEPEKTGPTSNRVFSAIILWNPIPTPSITANKHTHPIAEFLAALYPPLMASAPPVKNAAITVYLSAPNIAS
jgi:hypothetical protein